MRIPSPRVAPTLPGADPAAGDVANLAQTPALLLWHSSFISSRFKGTELGE